MSYTRETWVELASTDPSSTPITAIRLNNIEAGIENSHGRSLATSDRDLLVSSDGNLFTGRVIFNNTLGLAEWWDGTTWASGSAGGESPADVTKSTSVEGTSRRISRANHKHDIQTTGPVNISTSNAESTGTALARAGHIHNHPSGLGVNLHHNDLHEGNHRSTGSDALSHNNLSGFGTDNHHLAIHSAAHEPGGGDVMAVDAAAGTGSLRTIGTTSAVQGFPGNAQASAAEINGETDVSKYVPPDLMKHNPGIVGAFANFEQDGTHTITNSFNCTSIADNGTGKSTITLTNSIGASPTAIAVSGDATVKHCDVITVAATSVRCDFYDSTHADADTSVGRMIAIGSLA